MADITGALHITHADRELTLRLTLGGIGKLQRKHGVTIGGLLDEGRDEGELLNFGILVDTISVALQKGMRMETEEADDLADDLLTADQEIAIRLLNAAFPEAGTRGKGKSTGKSRARR